MDNGSLKEGNSERKQIHIPNPFCWNVFPQPSAQADK